MRLVSGVVLWQSRLSDCTLHVFSCHCHDKKANWNSPHSIMGAECHIPLTKLLRTTRYDVVMQGSSDDDGTQENPQESYVRTFMSMIRQKQTPIELSERRVQTTLTTSMTAMSPRVIDMEGVLKCEEYTGDTDRTRGWSIWCALFDLSNATWEQRFVMAVLSGVVGCLWIEEPIEDCESDGEQRLYWMGDFSEHWPIENMYEVEGESVDDSVKLNSEEQDLVL